MNGRVGVNFHPILVGAISRMKVYRDLNGYHKVQNAVVTTGTFDGVHYGHQKIVSRLKEVAKSVDGETVILTFFPHPRQVLYPDDAGLKLINTLDERIELLRKFQVNHLIIIPFTKEFSRLTSEEFIRQIVVTKIGTRKLVIGYDHHFGKNREGTFEHLKKYAPQYGFEVEEIPEQDVDEVAVSSTKIRKALLCGDVATANHYLGHPFTLRGKVVKGDRIGRTLGYPTANICIEENYKLIPDDGIYAVRVHHRGSLHNGMLYIGHRPTIGGMARNIEVNIFDFDEEIYDEELNLELLHFIRRDVHFENIDLLKKEMKEDELKIRNYFL